MDDDLGGHGFILATIDTSGQYSTRSIPAYVQPFLKVITHPSILDCLSVDSFVGTKCGLCMVKISDVMLPCGHVKKTLMCHQMRSLESIKCDVKVDKIVTKCGHVLRLACFIDVTSEIFSCTEPCTKILGCSHNCGGVCGKCSKKSEDGVVSFKHPRCTKKCDRPHGVCSHRCLKVCHDGESCGNCEAKCGTS